MTRTPQHRLAAFAALAALVLGSGACDRPASPPPRTDAPGTPAPTAPDADRLTPTPDAGYRPPPGTPEADVAATADRPAEPAPADVAPDPGPPSDGTPDAAAPDAGPTPDTPADVDPDAVPPENLEAGPRPTAEAFAPFAAGLLEAIRTGDPSGALPAFFPAAAFDRVKDLPDPGAYHRRLVRWFEEDVRLEHQALGGDIDSLTLEGIRLGRCDWIEKHQEGNLLPYWSCRRTRLQVRADGRPREIEIRVLINWGPALYVTHLRPVRR